ncbi:MAG: hypothetical protein QM765_40565 [Myxococcales bacterium]
MSELPMGSGTRPVGASSRWPLAVPALYLLAACVLGAVVTTLAHGAYTALLISDGGRGSLGGLEKYLTLALRAGGYLLGIAQVFAVALLWRSNAPVRSMAGAALGMASADLVLGGLSDLGWSFAYDGGAGVRALLQALGWILALTSVTADALIFETALKLRRDGSGELPGPDNTLRGLFWAGWGPRLVLWVLGLLGMHRLLPPWPMFGVRSVLTLLIGVAALMAIRAAVLVAEAPAPAEGDSAAAPPPAHPSSLASREAGLRNLGLGMLWVLIGGGVTAFTYASASSSGGGRYVVAYGAIAAGLVQAVVGVAQLLRSR